MKPIKKNQSRWTGFKKYYRSVLGLLIGIGVLIGLILIIVLFFAGQSQWNLPLPNLSMPFDMESIKNLYHEIGGKATLLLIIIVTGLFISFILKK